MNTTQDLSKLRIQRQAPARRRRSPRWPWLVAIALIGALGFVFRAQLLGIWGLGAWLGGEALHVRTGKAVRINPLAGAEVTSASGFVVARTKASVASPIQGRLVALHVDTAHRVAAGQLLAEIEHDLQDAALARARAEQQLQDAEVAAAELEAKRLQRVLEVARARLPELGHETTEAEVTLADAERTLGREREILAAGQSSQEQVDLLAAARDRAAARLELVRARQATQQRTVAESEAQLALGVQQEEVAKRAAAAAAAAVGEAEVARDLAFIRAPFEGVVLRKDAEVGEVVTPTSFGSGGSRTAIVTMADFQSLEFEVDVFERDIGLVADAMPCRIVLDGFQQEPLRGNVRQIEPTADRQKATVLVKITFVDRHPRMLPEMSGRVSFLQGEVGEQARAPERILVPASAVTERGGERGVFVLESGKVRFVPVGETVAEGDKLRVARGLRGGESVVIAPPADLQDGAGVRTDS